MIETSAIKAKFAAMSNRFVERTVPVSAELSGTDLAFSMDGWKDRGAGHPLNRLAGVAGGGLRAWRAGGLRA